MTITVEQLTQSAFAQKCLLEAVRVDGYLTRDALPVEPEFVRDPDEHEFYVLMVGAAITEVLGIARQLEHSVAYVSSFSYSRIQKDKKVSRVDHLQYVTENFLLRTQTVYDRLLQLVAATFHLLLDQRDCHEKTVIRNVRVSRTSIPKALVAFRKVTDTYRDSRNEVVHRGSFKHDILCKARLFELTDSIDGVAEQQRRYWRAARAKYVKAFATKQKKEIVSFNRDLLVQMENLFSELDSVYDEQRQRLKQLFGEVGA
jgi:hypothetical protein